MKDRMIVAGFGGQGVMMIGQLLCYAAVEHGKEALFLPQYGPEQRGGTANCFVIISEHPIGSPTANKIDTLIAMNKPSLLRFQDRVKPGGVIFINSSLIDSKDVRKDVTVFAVPIDNLAVGLGSQKVANIIMLGAYVQHSGFFTQEQILNTISANLAKKPQLLEMNKTAVRLGMEKVAA
jgi:2-oxoglutarate ferredoxin oxidoreductase subunit gamma